MCKTEKYTQLVQIMKTLKHIVTEKLILNKSTKQEYNYQPKDRSELRELLQQLIEKRGKSADLNDIDTSQIVDMENLFKDLDPHFIKISNWDVSNVKSMGWMFRDCKYFKCDLSNWDVSNVINMREMFANCSSFNSDLSEWDVSNVQTMSLMFYNCKEFNSDLSKWQTGKVITMREMFRNCKKFDCDLSKWDVSEVLNMMEMFEGSGFNHNIDSWQINPNNNLSWMFNRCPLSKLRSTLPTFYKEWMIS